MRTMTILILLLAGALPALAQQPQTWVIKGTTVTRPAAPAPALKPEQAVEVLKQASPAFRSQTAQPAAPSGRTGSAGPSLGPWEFPPERPTRRLDGTLLTDPPAVYGPTIVPFVILLR